MDSVNPETSDSSDSANDTGGAGDTLRPMEALDADEVRNADGDDVVDPPESWSAADQIAEEPDGETLDDKLAAEEPDRPAGRDRSEARESRELDVEAIDPEQHGTTEGQVSGTPEDGDSIFPVVE